MKRPRLKKIAASILAAVMMMTSSPAAVFFLFVPDLSDPGIVTEVDSVTDLTEEDVEFLPSGEDELPEIIEIPSQPEIPDPSPEETEPEFDPEQKISALVLGANSTATQQITTHWEYTYYHAFQQQEAPWATATIGGELAYCVDMTNFHTNSGVNMGSSTTYPSLSADQKYVLAILCSTGPRMTVTFLFTWPPRSSFGRLCMGE